MGQSVPDCGRDGAGVEVDVDVPPQTQLTELVQSGFLQEPWKQTRSLAQLKLLPQVPPQELGVAPGGEDGLAVGLAEGLVLGVVRQAIVKLSKIPVTSSVAEAEKADNRTTVSPVMAPENSAISVKSDPVL